MYYIKIGFTIFFLAGTVSSFIYSFNLFLQFLAKRISKSEVIKKTFRAIFCGFMSIFLAYSLWLTGWNMKSLIFLLVLSSSVSFMAAIASVAPFWSWKE
jgi:hypothetical protein